MITRVYGKVDNVEVIFDYAGGSSWEAAVPFDRDGVYIVELYAENDSGDRTFYATALFIITADGTCVEVKVYPYCARVLPCNWDTNILVNQAEVFCSPWETKTAENFCAKIVRCELCGRY